MQKLRSSSLNVYRFDSFINIVLPPNVKGMYIAPLSSRESEYEFLLAPGYIFEIIKIVGRNKYVITPINVEEANKLLENNMIPKPPEGQYVNFSTGPSPNKPTTAHSFFMRDIQKKLMQEFPDLGFAQVGKIVAETWAKASSQEKKPYQEKERQEHERYEREMDAHFKAHQSQDEEAFDM